MFLIVSRVGVFAFNLQIQKADVTCNGGNNGSISVTLLNNVNCGAGPYRYVLKNTSTGQILQISASTSSLTHQFNTLISGLYSVEIWDTWNGDIGSWCEPPVDINITQPSIISVSSQLTNVACNSFSTGSILLTVNGGTTGAGSGNNCKGYNISWTGTTSGGDPSCVCSTGNPSNCIIEIPTANPSATTNQYTLPNLPAGTYNITITDFAGCVLNINRNITQPPPITPTFIITNPTCSSDGGSILVSGLDASDGTPGSEGFNVSWQQTAPITGSVTTNTGAEINPGTSYTPFNIQVNPASYPASYSVTITDNNNCTFISPVQTLTVANESPTISPQSSICVGATTTLTANQAAFNSTPWLSSNPSVATINPSSGLVTALSPGTTTITYKAITGCSNTFTLTVNPLPVFTLSTPPTICAGVSTTLTATSSPNTTPYTYTWSTASSNAGVTSSSITVNPTTNTTYTVTATNTSTGCSSSQSILVTVNPLPVPVITVTPSNTICAGQTATIGTSTYSSYSWSTGGGTAQSFTTSSAGTYTVTVTNSNGCVGSASSTLSVISAPTVAITSPSTICAGSSITLATTTTNPTGGTYLWSNSATTSSISVSPTATTTYTLTYSVGACSSTASTTVTVVALPTLTVNSPTICSGQSTTLTAVGTPGGGSYLWSNSLGSGVSVSPSGLTNSTTVNTTQTFTVTYTSTINNCTATAISTVTIKPIPTVTVNPVTICNGASASLTATGTPSGGTYLWSTGATTQGISVNPTSTTTYNVTYTLNGCSSAQGLP